MWNTGWRGGKTVPRAVLGDASSVASGSRKGQADSGTAGKIVRPSKNFHSDPFGIMFGGGRYSLSATPFSVLSHAMIQCEDLGYFWPRIEETLLLSEGATMGDWACRVCFLEQSREGTAGDELACMADGFGALGFGLWGP